MGSWVQRRRLCWRRCGCRCWPCCCRGRTPPAAAPFRVEPGYVPLCDCVFTLWASPQRLLPPPAPACCCCSRGVAAQPLCHAPRLGHRQGKQWRPARASCVDPASHFKQGAPVCRAVHAAQSSQWLQCLDCAFMRAVLVLPCCPGLQEGWKVMAGSAEVLRCYSSPWDARYFSGVRLPACPLLCAACCLPA